MVASFFLFILTVHFTSVFVRKSLSWSELWLWETHPASLACIYLFLPTSCVLKVWTMCVLGHLGPRRAGKKMEHAKYYSVLFTTIEHIYISFYKHKHHPLTIHSVYPSILLLHSESLVRLWAPGCRRYSGFGTELDHGCTPASVYSHHSHRTEVRGVTSISVLLCVLKVQYGLVQTDVGGFKNEKFWGPQVFKKNLSPQQCWFTIFSSAWNSLCRLSDDVKRTPNQEMATRGLRTHWQSEAWGHITRKD